MKIFIGTQEEPFYLPLFFSGLLEKITGHQIVGVNILPPFNSQSDWTGVIRDYWGMFGPQEFFVRGFIFSWHKMADTFHLDRISDRPHSVRRVFEKYHVPIHRVRRQNTDEFRRLLDCDLFVSVANPIIVKNATLSYPKQGCINFHAGYLPRYRGINPSFWALFNGEKQTAFTVHRMDEKIDNGPILAQKIIPIEANESLHGLFLKVTQEGPALMAKVIDEIAAGTSRPQPNDEAKATYFGFPTPADGRLFRQRKRKYR